MGNRNVEVMCRYLLIRIISSPYVCVFHSPVERSQFEDVAAVVETGVAQANGGKCIC